MRIHLRFRPQRRPPAQVELAEGATVEDAMKAVQAHADSTIVVRRGVPVAEDETLADGDELELVSSFSGG